MPTADTGLLSEVVVVGKEKGKQEVETVDFEEMNERPDSLQPRSNNNAEPLLAPVPTEHSDTEERTQSVRQRTRFQELPEDLAEVLVGRVFESDDDFEATLKELKIADEPLVLGDDSKAYYYMPGEEHSVATHLIVSNFHEWARRVKGTAGANTNANWDRDALEHHHHERDASQQRDCLMLHCGDEQSVNCAMMVSMFNDEDYEVDAINDLATRAIAGQGTPPKLGVLKKLREAGPALGVRAGFDIYYLPAGTFWRDALNGAKGARPVVYNHGGPDVSVTITEDDLGGFDLSFWQSIKGFFVGGSKVFELSMAELYGVLV